MSRTRPCVLYFSFFFVCRAGPRQGERRRRGGDVPLARRTAPLFLFLLPSTRSRVAPRLGSEDASSSVRPPCRRAPRRRRRRRTRASKTPTGSRATMTPSGALLRLVPLQPPPPCRHLRAVRGVASMSRARACVRSLSSSRLPPPRAELTFSTSSSPSLSRPLAPSRTPSQCRQRKVKCSREQTCSNCRLRGSVRPLVPLFPSSPLSRRSRRAKADRATCAQECVYIGVNFLAPCVPSILSALCPRAHS